MSTAMAGIPAFCILPPNSFDPIPDLFPKHTLNLLVGASKIGKTNLLFAQIDEYLSSGQLLGMSAPTVSERVQSDHPHLGLHLGQWMRASIGYIAMNRTRHDVMSQLRAAPYRNLNKSLFPFVASIDTNVNRTTPEDNDTLLGAYYRLLPNRPQLLLVDSIHLLVGGNPNDPAVVASFCTRLRNWQAANDVTIWATILPAKQKIGEGYARTADKIAGCATLAESATSLADLEMVDERRRPKTLTRALTITPPRSKQRTIYFDFNDSSMLAPCDDPTPMLEHWKDQLTERLSSVTPGAILLVVELREWGTDLGISSDSVERWIAERIVANEIRRVKKGTYQRSYAN